MVFKFIYVVIILIFFIENCEFCVIIFLLIIMYVYLFVRYFLIDCLLSDWIFCKW